jgi:NADPH:quinone reductase-like Zn-dependent oxidoreductase
MRAVRYHESGGPDTLRIDELERPEPAPDEVLVEMGAASINPVDVKLREHRAPRLPKTTGSDIAGTVAAVGTDVDNYDQGDRVFATGLHVARFAGGSFADFAVVPTDLLAPLPEDVAFEEGAAVALVGVTAWRAMVHHGCLEPGSTAFIHGGNGGVGHVAVGLADALGATPVATARPEHHDAVRSLGAETVLDYARDDFAEAAVEATGGADLILDHMVGRYFETDVELAVFGGHVAVISGGAATLPDVSAARSKELDIHMMSMSNLASRSDTPTIGSILTPLGRLMAEERLEVVIDRTYPLEEATEAHRAVTEESFVGKIVITP